MHKKITVFNNKGGVSKTTSTYHLGWTLANMGYKVLLVDGDPQCNLTELFLGADFERYYIDEATKKHNIKDGSAAPFAGQNTPIQPIDCPHSPRQQNLYLLPGSLELSEFDRQLSMAMTVPTALQAMSSLPGAMNALIDAVSQKYKIDYVLIDLNPGVTAINQAMVVSSDGFIIPTNPDIFCIMALKMLKKVLPEWQNWKHNNLHVFQNSSYPLPVNAPKFIGTIVQRFNIRNGEPVSAHQANIDKINETVVNELLPTLTSAGMVFSSDDYSKANLMPGYTLAQVRDFTSLGAKSHSYYVPVFELTDIELEYTGNVLAKAHERQEDFKVTYEKAAQSIVSLLA